MPRLAVVLGCLILLGCDPAAAFEGDYSGEGTILLTVGIESGRAPSAGVRQVQLRGERLVADWGGCALNFEPASAASATLDFSDYCAQPSRTLRFKDGYLAVRDGGLRFLVQGTFQAEDRGGVLRGVFRIDETWARREVTSPAR